MQKLANNVTRALFPVLRTPSTTNSLPTLPLTPSGLRAKYAPKTVYEPRSILDQSPWALDKEKYNEFRCDLRCAVEIIADNNPRGLQYEGVDARIYEALLPEWPELSTWSGRNTFILSLRDCLTNKHHTALQEKKKGGKVSSKALARAHERFEYTTFEGSASAAVSGAKQQVKRK
ncbi:hypothetical protein FRC17_000260 [Serendipita sp. 399]|nr:hypothetical protein FRC17_000260 [Serendipita sp. 399]